MGAAEGLDLRTEELTATVNTSTPSALHGHDIAYRAFPRRRALSVLAGLGALCLGLVSLPGSAGTLDAGSVKETVFPSGLRLLVKESHATDLAAVQVWVRAGGFREDEKTNGTAHVIEHLVFKGSDTGGPGTLDGEVENLGGLLEATTEKDWTRFNCTVAGRYVGRIVNVVADALRKPKFDQNDWEAERPVIVDEITRISLDPDIAMARLLYSAAFQKHPYRMDVRGEPRFIQTLDLKDVRAYYQKHYVPANMTVIVVGSVDGAAVERAVRTAFQADTPAPKPAESLPEPEVACVQPVRRSINSPYQNGYVGLAFPAPSVKDTPDVYAMDVLLTLLEMDGTGRLPRLMRDQGEVSASFETRRQPGLMTIIASTGPRNTEQVETLIKRELELTASQAIPESEIGIAKRILRGAYVLDNETYSGQAGTLGYYAAIDRWQFASDYLARIDAVTPEQVQAVARKYLQMDHSATILLKPAPGPAAPPRSDTE